MNQVNRNRLANCLNEYQGNFTRVLTVCSAGLLRSPTIARVLTRDFDNVNTRAVGTSSDYALVPLDMVHLKWANNIICANYEVFQFVTQALKECNLERNCVHLNIPDVFGFGDPQLEAIIREELAKVNSSTKEKEFELDVSLSKYL